MYRQLQGFEKKENDMYKKVYCRNSHLGLPKLMRTRKCWARDCIRRSTDLGASSAFWQNLLTINPSTYLQFSRTDNCEMSIVTLATKQLQICVRYLGQVYIHLSSASGVPSMKDSHFSLLKTWPFRSVRLLNTPGGLFFSPSICVYVFIAQGHYVPTGIDYVP